MLTYCWSPKGGSGTTVIASSLALLTARHMPTVLVDAGGDAPGALGIGEAGGPGLLDWLAAPHASSDDLFRLATPVVDDLRLIGRGAGPHDDLDPVRGSSTPPVATDWARFSVATAVRHDVEIVVDLGTSPPPPPGDGVRIVLVVRPCYLALRRAVRLSVASTAAVLVTEPGRSLGAGDVERSLDVPVVAEIPWDPAVARAVDAGLLASRLPPSIARPLRGLALGAIR